MQTNSEAIAKKVIERLQREANRLAKKPVGKVSKSEARHYLDLIAIQKLLIKH